jgi:hypothetical protein
MTDKHPYTPAQGHLIQVIGHFRSKSFPMIITADTLKKLGFAPKNESYILNILRFLGLIDQEGNKTEIASKIFSIHDDDAFSQEFGKQVASAYSALFDLHRDSAWNLSIDALISFFRTTDGTTELVGKHQARTFQSLAAFSGHGSIPESKSPPADTKKRSPRARTSLPTASPPQVQDQLVSSKRSGNFGLTVRIEINLPADGDQETYDRIFRSIRENLLNE